MPFVVYTTHKVVVNQGDKNLTNKTKNNVVNSLNNPIQKVNQNRQDTDVLHEGF
jgi:hypothetical protein